MVVGATPDGVSALQQETWGGEGGRQDTNLYTHQAEMMPMERKGEVKRYQLPSYAKPPSLLFQAPQFDGVHSDEPLVMVDAAER